MERELAKVNGMDIWLEDHGIIVMGGRFDYEQSSSQGFGYSIDINFVKNLMRVFKVEYLHQINGKSCWVTHDRSTIYKVEPLHKGDGMEFDVKKWSEETIAKANVRK